ncbi:MAG: hypothetical protein OES14_02965 [Nitrosopumilus sp.]|nr:hypothetical protein [Nitrosopumilus sp.]MDH3824733.1 hypothetical protein [Nitrosopumilus sp.]
MKTLAIIACLLSITFTVAYSEPQVSDSIKDEVQQLYSKNNLNEKTIMSILVDLSNQKIIKNTHVIQEIYPIPESGKVDFVKISGKIGEFGKTAHVTLEITLPDGTKQTLNSPLIETGRYSTIFPIDSKSQVGTYRIQTEFAGELQSVSFFHLTKEKLPSSNFPPWLITTFEWWAEDEISDSEIIYSIQHLANMGLVVLSEKAPPALQVVISGEDLVRRGVTHTINVQVTDGYYPIEGAKVTLTIEDYGEDIIREFDGLTNQNGYFVFSWEVPKSFNDIETLLAFISVSGNGSSQTHLWKFQVYCLPGTSNCNIDGN